RRRHTSSKRDWSSDVCSYDLKARKAAPTSVPGSFRERKLLLHTKDPVLLRLPDDPARTRTSFPETALLSPCRQEAGRCVRGYRRSEERRVGKECRARDRTKD